jgi:GH25 family lysozyme M1 (1,4-beta-N-acetylmuramidase)
VTAVYCHGLDASAIQDPADWPRYRDQGYTYAWLKVSEGLTHVDKSFPAHAEAAKKAGFLVGAYHFLHAPREEQRPAAEQFCKLVLQHGATDLRFAIDIEESDGVAPGPLVARAEAWTQAAEEILGVEALVYTGPGFWGSLKAAGTSSWLPRRGLWVADYNQAIKPGSSPPEPMGEHMPCFPWKTSVCWQWSGGVQHGLSNWDRNVATSMAPLLWSPNGRTEMAVEIDNGLAQAAEALDLARRGD